MDSKDLRTLKIMEEVEQDASLSQRDLARRLNISLGLVNSFVKRLVNKGFFKITTIPKNRARYVLTPKGMTEKSRLTFEYIHFSFEFYKRSRKHLKQLFIKLEAEGIGRVVFFGLSDIAEIAFLSLQETPIKLMAITDPKQVGQKFLGGLVVQEPGTLINIEFDAVILTGIESVEEDRRYLIQQGIPENKINLIQ